MNLEHLSPTILCRGPKQSFGRVWVPDIFNVTKRSGKAVGVPTVSGEIELRLLDAPMSARTTAFHQTWPRMSPSSRRLRILPSQGRNIGSNPIGDALDPAKVWMDF